MSATARHPPALIPLILVTGFFGAGKSTLLNALKAHDLCTQALILTADTRTGRFASDVPSLALPATMTGAGCLCCTGRGDWTQLLERLLRERDNHRIPAFDRLLVETTGDADPLAMLTSIIGHPYLSLRFRPTGILTVVGGPNPLENPLAHPLATLAQFPEARRQITLADRVILNPDMASKDPGTTGSASLRTALAKLAPDARILTFAEALHDPAAILSATDSPSGLHTQQGRRETYQAAFGPRTSRLSAGPAQHETGIRHSVYDRPVLLSAQELEQLLAGFSEAFGASILRISGHASARERPGLRIGINVVRGRLMLSESGNDLPGTGLHLNIIAHGLSPEHVRTYCAAFVAACS